MQIRSRLEALRDEIHDAADTLEPTDLAQSKGAGARALADLSVAMVWLAASLSYCAGRLDGMLAQALEDYEAADAGVARRLQ